MGYHIFIRKLLAGDAIVVDGDGTDSRSNTFVADCVRGIMAAGMSAASRGEIFNIGGGQEVTVNEVLEMLAELTGQEPRIEHGPPRPGDQRRTAADVTKARTLLGYEPQVGVYEGLRRQVEWQRAQES
jgi:nucleoside-diphosphate-sugar epimerase